MEQVERFTSGPLPLEHWYAPVRQILKKRDYSHNHSEWISQWLCAAAINSLMKCLLWTHFYIFLVTVFCFLFIKSAKDGIVGRVLLSISECPAFSSMILFTSRLFCTSALDLEGMFCDISQGAVCLDSIDPLTILLLSTFDSLSVFASGGTLIGIERKSVVFDSPGICISFRGSLASRSGIEHEVNHRKVLATCEL